MAKTLSSAGSLATARSSAVGAFHTGLASPPTRFLKDLIELGHREAGDSQRMAREAVEQNLGTSAADSDDQSAPVLRSPGRGIHEEDITEDHPTVFVVDDDASARRSVARLLRSAGCAVETHASAAEFLRSDSGRPRPGCIVLDLRMPELDGLDV